MNTYRIEEIQKQCAYPDSQSVYTAMCQVWNEVGQEYQEDIQELKQQLEQAQARIARLKTHAEYAVERLSNDDNTYADVLNRIVKETPAQSLAELEARAVEKFKQHIITLIDEDLSGDEECDIIVPIHEFDFFKSQLRQQAGSGE